MRLPQLTNGGSGSAQPMAGKPARMGRASGYIMRAFAKAPQILLIQQRLQDVLNTISQARAPSTRHLYALKWSVFSAW